MCFHLRQTNEIFNISTAERTGTAMGLKGANGGWCCHQLPRVDSTHPLVLRLLLHTAYRISDYLLHQISHKTVHSTNWGGKVTNEVKLLLFVKTVFSATMNTSMEIKILYFTCIQFNIRINLVLQSDLRCLDLSV